MAERIPAQPRGAGLTGREGTPFRLVVGGGRGGRGKGCIRRRVPEEDGGLGQT